MRCFSQAGLRKAIAPSIIKMRCYSFNSPQQRRKAEHFTLSRVGCSIQLNDMQKAVGPECGSKACHQRHFICRHNPVQRKIADDRIERLFLEGEICASAYFKKIYIRQSSSSCQANVLFNQMRFDREKADSWVLRREREGRGGAVRAND